MRETALVVPEADGQISDRDREMLRRRIGRHISASTVAVGMLRSISRMQWALAYRRSIRAGKLRSVVQSAVLPANAS